MRIVHVSDYYMPRLGYQESILPRYHARNGHDVHVVTSDRYTNVPHYEESWRPLLGDRFVGAGVAETDGVTVHRLGGAFERRDRILLRGLARELRQIRPDAIFGHGTTNYTAFQLAGIARRLRVPLFLDCHMLFTVQDTSPRGRAFYRALKLATSTLLTPRVTTFFGVAEEACDFLRQAQGIPLEKIQHLPLGLDAETFSARPAGAAALREHLGLPEDALLIMQTGKLTPDKAPHLLSLAAAPLMVQDHRLHLVLVGGGSEDYMAEVEDPLIRAGVQDRLMRLPLVPAAELATYFTAADIVVFPGGSSLSCIEAAGCGAAVVMTDLPAGQHRAASGIGITFSDGDSGDLSATLDRLVSDAPLRGVIGARAREAVMSKFSYRSVAATVENAMAAASVP